MPRQKPIIETRLPEIMPRGSAGVIDSTVQVPVTDKGGSSTFRDIASGLRNLSPTVDKYITLQETQADINAKMGMIDKAMGKAPKAPRSLGNLGWGYNQGYSLAAGEATGIKIAQEYRNELQRVNYFADDPNASSAAQKRQALLNTITDRHLKGQTSVAMLAGASQRITDIAVKGEEAAYEAHSALRTGRIMQNQRPIVSELVKGFKTHFMDAASSKVAPNTLGMRDQLSRLKTSLVEQGLTHHQAATLVIDQVGQELETLAASGHLPTRLTDEMLELFKGTDSDGFSWYTAAEGKGSEAELPYRRQIDQIITNVQQMQHQAKMSLIDSRKATKDFLEPRIMLKVIRKDPTWFQDAEEALAQGIDIPFTALNNQWKESASGIYDGNSDDPVVVEQAYAMAHDNPRLQRGDMLHWLKGGKITEATVTKVLQASLAKRGIETQERTAGTSATQAANMTRLERSRQAKAATDAMSNDLLLTRSGGALSNAPASKIPLIIDQAKLAYTEEFVNTGSEQLAVAASNKAMSRALVSIDAKAPDPNSAQETKFMKSAGGANGGK